MDKSFWVFNISFILMFLGSNHFQTLLNYNLEQRWQQFNTKMDTYNTTFLHFYTWHYFFSGWRWFECNQNEFKKFHKIFGPIFGNGEGIIGNCNQHLRRDITGSASSSFRRSIWFDKTCWGAPYLLNIS